MAHRIAIVLGTRPEIIKLAPLILELEARAADFFIVHTGQHFSENMDRIFWDTFLLPAPKYHLAVRERTHARQTAEMLRGIDDIMEIERPDWVIVQGDTNSVLAGALVAAKRSGPCRIGHVEAGLRSFDRSMPEEINRILVDHVSDLLFAPTEASAAQLLREGIPAEKIHVVGNTIEDILIRHVVIARAQSRILSQMELEKGRYLLMTIHRQENTEEASRLLQIINAAVSAAEKIGLKTFFPVHPRTRARLETAGWRVPESVRLSEPLGYHDFLAVLADAACVATDSGGLQEEACILRVPCVTLRENTERPETVEIGANIVAGTTPASIESAIRMSLESKRNWSSPYGEGKASQRILNAIEVMSGLDASVRKARIS